MSYAIDNNGKNGVLLVVTRQHPSEMMKTGGVVMPNPRVNKQRIENNVKWIVCCDPQSNAAFLIGKVDNVIWVDGECVIKISEYAQVVKADVWTKHQGNKYGFTYLDGPADCSMRPGSYDFKKVNNGNVVNWKGKSYTTDNIKPEPVVVEAKPVEAEKNILPNDLRDALAKLLGVSRSQITKAEIEIKISDAIVSVKL